MKFSYAVSFDTLIQFTNAWGMDLLGGSTYKAYATIGVPWKKFKQIWHENPKIKSYPVPDGAEGFMEEVKVLDIKAR